MSSDYLPYAFIAGFLAIYWVMSSQRRADREHDLRVFRTLLAHFADALADLNFCCPCVVRSATQGPASEDEPEDG